MATNISDIDALKTYLEEKNLALVMDRQQEGRRTKVLMPFQWKWEDIEPAVVASGELVRLAENLDDIGGVLRRDTHLHRELHIILPQAQERSHSSLPPPRALG